MSLITRLMALPPTVAPEEERHFRLHVALAVLMLGGHTLLGTLFTVMGQPWLALVYVGSNAVNVIALWISRRGRWRLGADLNLIELLSNVTVMAFLLGWRSGFFLYYAIAPLTSFLFVAGDLWRLAGYTVTGGVLGAVVLSTATTPIIVLPDWGTNMLLWLNTGAVCSAIFCYGVLGSRWVARSEARLAAEHARSERLLRNILPDEIASRLKDDTRTIAEGFDAVTVLFADIAGFTPLSARLTAQEVVAMLNDLFSSFDALVEKHRLEKIKTIGDAYMVVGGLPRPRADHAEAVAKLALEMLEVVRTYSERTGQALDVRIGVNSGPVVAGVIGTRKFAYDLWGDTVNTASRMESHGVAGRIQVTAATARLLEGRFELASRGTIAIKGLGEVETFFLHDGPRREGPP